LDAEGEWHQADGVLYFWAPGGVDPSRLTVEATRRRFAFDLSGRAHIHLRGLGVFAASLNLHEAERCVVDGLRATWVSCREDLRGGFNRDKGIGPDAEGLGVVLGGRGNVLRNSVIAWSMGDGVSIYGRDNTVENCVIHDCNVSVSDCAPVTCTGAGHVIRRCTLYNAGRSILVHRKLQRGRVEHNHMFHAGLIANDLGMTYTYHTDGQGTVIAYNRIHGNFARGWGCVGIYLDDMSSRHVVHHNVVYDVSEALAMNPPKSRNNRIYHNTLDGFRVSIGMSTRRPQDMTGTEIRNNIFTRALPKAMPNATLSNNLHPGKDAKFVDASRADYCLKPGSPAIDIGKVLAPYTDGFTGKAPDAGAFERDRAAWQAGSDLPEARMPVPPPVRRHKRRGR
jgi:hypothetical protein